jgi:hypothetical protein
MSDKLRDVLWPLGATVLALLGAPIAIEQYPETFKEAPWILPMIICIVCACWLVPLLFHDRVHRIVGWMIGRLGVPLGWIVVVVAAMAVVGLVVTGGYMLYGEHKRHLEARLGGGGKKSGIPKIEEAQKQVPSQDALAKIAADVGEIKSKVDKKPQREVDKEASEKARATDKAEVIKIPEAKYIPPKGPGIKFEGRMETPSSQMCTGMADAAQIACLCPRPLKYALKALPPPSDNNYATQIDIRAVREPIYKLRIFGRTQLHSGKLAAFPYGEGKAGTVVMEMDYDPFSLIVQSSAPQTRYTLEVRSAQGLRIKCVNQEN